MERPHRDPRDFTLISRDFVGDPIAIRSRIASSFESGVELRTQHGSGKRGSTIAEKPTLGRPRGMAPGMLFREARLERQKAEG